MTHTRSSPEIPARFKVNANQVFAWRRQYEQGLLEPSPAALLPVALIKPKRSKRLSPDSDVTDRSGDDYVEVELVGGERLRVRGRLASQLLGQLISRLGSR